LIKHDIFKKNPKKEKFSDFLIMSKVIRDFKKSTCMQFAAIASIVLVVITIGIFGIIFISNPDSNSSDVEDVVNKELTSTEETAPEIQNKLNEIEKINSENEYIPQEREWQTSGPFQIDRTEYAIGEKIFIRIGGLETDEKGQIAVMRPLNSTHYTVYMTIPFDEKEKSAFNYYLEPQISKNRNICDTDDITGKWVLVFRGTNYPNLEFEITEKVIPGTDIEIVC